MAQVEFSRHKVTLYEFELGWGSRVDDTLYFETEDEARNYVKNFNSKNTASTAPDWYMVAEYTNLR